MVALLGFFHHLEVLVEHALLGEGDAVDTGQLLAVLVALPVGAGDGGQLDGLDVVDVLDVRAAAQVGEGTVRVERDLAVLQVLDELALVLVALLLEIVHRIRLGHLLALERLLSSRQLDHLVLNRLEVGLGNLPVAQVHVVVETDLDSRSHTELDARVERFKRFRHQVGGRMPEDVFCLLVLPGTDGAIGECNRQHIVKSLFKPTKIAIIFCIFVWYE